MKLLVVISVLTASHAYADKFCKSHPPVKTGSVDEVQRAKLVDDALCKSSKVAPYYFDGIELTEVERFAHVTACLANEPTQPLHLTHFMAWCADDFAQYDDAAAKETMKKLGIANPRVEKAWDKNAPLWRAKVAELASNAKWKPLLAAYKQGADKWLAGARAHADDIAKARELQASAERDPAAAKGCTATAAKMMQGYLAAAKPKTLEALRGALADPLGYQIYAAMLACSAADELGPEAWVLTEQPSAMSKTIALADTFEVDPARGPRIAGALAVNAVLVKSKMSKQELRDMQFLSPGDAPKRDERLAAVRSANGDKLSGFQPDSGTVAAIKPDGDGRLLVTFKSETIKRDTETCKSTGEIERINADGTVQYRQWCQVTGSETEKVTPHAVIIAKELAAGLKPGTVVSYFWKGGSFSKGPDQGAIHTIWKDAKKKEIAGWAGTSW